jgi:hypothetical protein
LVKIQIHPGQIAVLVTFEVNFVGKLGVNFVLFCDLNLVQLISQVPECFANTNDDLFFLFFIIEFLRLDCRFLGSNPGLLFPQRTAGY